MSLYEIAETLYFNYQRLNKDDFYGWSFRKDKNVEDLKKAVNNANKYRENNDYAIRKLETSLMRIFKVDKSIANKK